MRLRLRDLELPLDGSAAIVGIVNVTPDSFYDGGQTAAAAGRRVERGRELVAAGAA